MRFLSLFSGIEAASAAWLPLGWECVGVAEIEPFASAVLASRYPDVPNLGDVLAPDFLQRASALRPDVLVGGPPCQDFSIAGLRAGLDGARGNLSLRWVEVVRAIRPTYAVTENVPGWLSVNRGHAFGAFLAGLVGHDTALVPPKSCGGRWTDAGMVDGPDGRVAWRILDAQYFGLAQRRRRVFAVFCPRGGADPAAVLFEPAGVQGHFAPRREAPEGVARCLANGSGSSGQRYDAESEDFVVSHSLRADGFDASEDGTGRGTPLVAQPYTLAIRGRGESHDLEYRQDGIANAVLTPNGGRAGIGVGAVCAFDARQSDVIQYGDQSGPLDTNGQTIGVCTTGSVTHALDSASAGQATEDGTGRGVPLVPVCPGGDTSKSYWKPADVANTVAAVQTPYQGTRVAYPNASVRRLTPEECEALQGFPRGYTSIPYRARPAADGNRYRALGNSMAVPVVAWIGRAIMSESRKLSGRNP